MWSQMFIAIPCTTPLHGLKIQKHWGWNDWACLSAVQLSSISFSVKFATDNQTNHQQLSLCQSWKCVLSPRKWYGDRPLQRSHFILTASLADPSQPGWVEPLDWHGQHNADLQHSKQLSLTLSRAITELHSCHPAKCCYMYPIQTSQARRYGQPREQKEDTPTIECFLAHDIRLIGVKMTISRKKMSLSRRRGGVSVCWAHLPLL